nr:hypothetical protein [Tanacetum cinerariifolium]
MHSFNSIVRAFVSLGHDLGNSYVYDPNPNSFNCPPDSYHPPHPTYETYSYDSYGNDSQFGYDCQPHFSLHYESEPGYNENYSSYPYDSSSLQQQYLCCAHYGGPHMNYQCQPMNQDFYNSNSLGFDQPQPPQSPVIHQPPQELSIQEMEDLKQQYLDELQRLSNLEYHDEIKISELKENFNGMSIEIQKKEKLLQEEYEDFSESNEEFSSIDDDSFSLDDIDYVKASPPDSELVSSESCSDEDVLEKIVSKPLSEEEIITIKSLCTHDSSLPISSKIDSLLDEFVGELALLKSISPGVDETDCDFEEDIHLIKKLLYDNSSPRPPEEFVSANSDAKSKSFSPSPILVKDSDSFMEEIDLFCTSDYPMPPGIVDEYYDSERDILIPKDLPSNNSLSFAKKESFHFDIPLFSRPPAKPPDGDTGFLNIKMMGDISDQKAFMHKLMITLTSHQEKSPDLLSHRCGTVKKFNSHRSHLNKCPMLIHGQNNPPLDVLLFHFYPP